MKKPRSAHQIVTRLIDKGYTYKQLAQLYGLSPGTLHAMYSRPDYQESAQVRDRLNAKQPKEPPRWGKTR